MDSIIEHWELFVYKKGTKEQVFYHEFETEELDKNAEDIGEGFFIDWCNITGQKKESHYFWVI